MKRIFYLAFIYLSICPNVVGSGNTISLKPQMLQSLSLDCQRLDEVLTEWLESFTPKSKLEFIQEKISDGQSVSKEESWQYLANKLKSGSVSPEYIIKGIKDENGTLQVIAIYTLYNKKYFSILNIDSLIANPSNLSGPQRKSGLAKRLIKLIEDENIIEGKRNYTLVFALPSAFGFYKNLGFWHLVKKRSCTNICLKGAFCWVGNAIRKKILRYHEIMLKRYH